VRVGDDPVRRDRKAAAVAEADHLIVDHRDRHDTHDSASGRGNVVGGCRTGQPEGEREKKQQTDHAPAFGEFATAINPDHRTATHRRIHAPVLVSKLSSLRA
jgi:hypothetical protein